jgi:hypothetical protein
MGLPAGKTLTVLALAMIFMSGVSAYRIAASGGPWASPFTASPPGPSADEYLLSAMDAERRGDLAEALAGYRKAVTIRPEIADRRSPEFLGSGFEEKVKTWISDLRKGKVSAGPTALPDASFLFRRIYGGCG